MRKPLRQLLLVKLSPIVAASYKARGVFGVKKIGPAKSGFYARGYVFHYIERPVVEEMLADAQFHLSDKGVLHSRVLLKKHKRIRLAYKALAAHLEEVLST